MTIIDFQCWVKSRFNSLNNDLASWDLETPTLIRDSFETSQVPQGLYPHVLPHTFRPVRWVPPHPHSHSSVSHSLCGLSLPEHTPKTWVNDSSSKVSNQARLLLFLLPQNPQPSRLPLTQRSWKIQPGLFHSLGTAVPTPPKEEEMVLLHRLLRRHIVFLEWGPPTLFRRWSSGMVMLAACEGQECTGKLSSMFSQEWMESEL